jgi:signal transduction histidine kinase
MFAIPVIIKRGAIVTAYKGSLINLPAELLTPGRVKKIFEAPSIGWSRDDMNYFNFSKYDFEGNLLVVPGVIIEGERRPKKFYGYDISFTKNQIEAFVNDIIEFEKRSFEKASEDVNMLVHDLRKISNSIYNAALEAETWLDRGNLGESYVRIQNVIASQMMLKIRTDVLDFMGNPASVIRSRQIEVYRKVDKVCRSLKPEAKMKGVSIRLSGSCYKILSGPDVFEVVPFALVENAVKYSPVGGEVNVEVMEESANVKILVSSLGPRIHEHEFGSIFEKGVRGMHAEATSIPGSGFGLFLLKSLVEDHFNGTISVSQDGDVINFNDLQYSHTTFIVEVPASEASPLSRPSVRYRIAR